MDDNKPLTSVHEALSNAAFASRVGQGDPVSFRLDPETKQMAMSICDRHGTNLSEFLRQCCMGLVDDYSDPSRG